MASTRISTEILATRISLSPTVYPLCDPLLLFFAGELGEQRPANVRRSRETGNEAASVMGATLAVFLCREGGGGQQCTGPTKIDAIHSLFIPQAHTSMGRLITDCTVVIGRRDGFSERLGSFPRFAKKRGGRRSKPGCRKRTNAHTHAFTKK